MCTPPPKKNVPRFLDYRRNPLPLDVAVSLSLPEEALPVGSTCLFPDILRNPHSFNGGDADINAKNVKTHSSQNHNSARQLILSGNILVNGTIESCCHRYVCRLNDNIEIVVPCVGANNGNDKKINTNDFRNNEIDEHTHAMKENGKEQVQTSWSIATTIRLHIASPRYFVCYKPRGVVCSNQRNTGIDREDVILISDWLASVSECSLFEIKDDNNNGGDVYKLFTTGKGRCGIGRSMQTVGRLDEQSEGLLFLTNDGSFSRPLCDPEFGFKKTYRVIVRGSGYDKIMTLLTSRNDDFAKIGCRHCTADAAAAIGVGSQQCCTHHQHNFCDMISEMIDRGNRIPTISATPLQKTYFPYESLTVLDAGRLPLQHASDDSYFALIDIVLREGKRHAVRRIIKNSSSLRVCFLSRIAVEGLRISIDYDVTKPQTLMDAHLMGCLIQVYGDGGQVKCLTRGGKVPVGKMLSRSYYHSCHHDRTAGGDCIILHPGHVIELRKCDIDRFFDLKKTRSENSNAEERDEEPY